MTMRIGRPAPWFEAEAYVPGEDSPRRMTLDDFAGSWRVFFFYPRDFTFVCPTELQAFAELEAAFTAEAAALLAASTDSFWSHKAWFESHPMLGGVRYPVLADSAQGLGSAYDVLLEDGSALRATFIIDPQGVVRHATASDQSVGRSPEETLRCCKRCERRPLPGRLAQGRTHPPSGLIETAELTKGTP
jgi:alkyl hydroperoxide reductase subunit AhpC